jgi:predicted dehydrogenase
LSLTALKNENGQIQITQNNIEVGSHDPLEEEIRSFITAVIGRSAPVVSGEDARLSLQLAVNIINKMKGAQNIFK